MRRMTTLPDIKSLVARLGGPVVAGRAIGRSHAAVCQWKKIPARYLLSLELHSIARGQPVLREEMRPDLFIRDAEALANSIDVSS